MFIDPPTIEEPPAPELAPSAAERAERIRALECQLVELVAAANESAAKATAGDYDATLYEELSFKARRVSDLRAELEALKRE